MLDGCFYMVFFDRYLEGGLSEAPVPPSLKSELGELGKCFEEPDEDLS